MKSPDAAIIERCLKGDGNAFSLLVAKYQNAVYGLCYHMVGNFADAQDLTQEAFVKAYLDLARIRDPARFASWLHSITVNTCKMWLRDRKRADDLPLDAVAESQAEFTDDGSPMEYAEAEELHLSITQAIASLSEKNRLAITLYYIDGLSYDEIGDFLSVPQSTIKSRLHRARKRLKKELISMVEDNFDKHKLPEDFPEKVIQEVVISCVKTDPKTKVRIVVLQNKADREQLLPIWIGNFEALAIIQRLQGSQTERPMTHDLMGNILKEFDMKVVRIVVTDLKETTLYAKITIESDGTLKEIDARPSDSIALALRTNSPIFVAKSVLSESGIRQETLETTKVVDVESDELKKGLQGATRGFYMSPLSLFETDSKFQSDLDSGNISEELRQEFESHGTSLSDSASVSDNLWHITDGDKRYIIRKKEGKLSISQLVKMKRRKEEKETTD